MLFTSRATLARSGTRSPRRRLPSRASIVRHLRGSRLPVNPTGLASEGTDQNCHIPVPLDWVEVLRRLGNRKADPATAHVTPAPALRVAGHAADRAVHVLEHVRAL